MTESKETCIDSHLMAELEAAANLLAQGRRDPEEAKQAAARMDQRREKNRQVFGVQNIGVEIIRSMRDSR